MITKPTVLILGAGASIPYGFPSGEALIDKIIEVLESCGGERNEISNALNFNPIVLERIARNIRECRPQSIDSYLRIKWNLHSHFSDAIKGAIAAALLPLEADNKDVVESHDRPGYLQNNANTLQDDWYRVLWNSLHDQASNSSEFEKNDLSILTFNYDRSLTEYLHRRIMAMYDLDPVAAGVLLRKAVNIIHVHGSLGVHPALSSEDAEQNDIIPYGSDVDYKTIIAARKRIKIIYESEQADEIIAGVRRSLTKAEFVAFLGLRTRVRSPITLFAADEASG